ncbi:MAG: hypothetical protein KDA81_10345 [Planctomycetaceae bacterium]|nr:hypothetical protein [Planctomycetaceae bacterium]
MSISLNIPVEGHSELVAWLEEQITGTQLRRLVGELLVIHRPHVSRSVQEICGAQWADVMDGGLTSLSAAQIRELLTFPQTLLQLQEQVFVEGSSYWMQRFGNSEAGRHALLLADGIQQAVLSADRITAAPTESKTSPGGSSDRSRSGKLFGGDSSSMSAARRNEHKASGPGLPVSPTDEHAPAPAVPRNQHSPTATGRPIGRWLVSLTALAGMLLLAFLLQPDPVPRGWGFNAPDLLAFQGTEQEFLNHLADAASQWSNRTPTNGEQLQTRLTQFSNGCGQLIRTLDEPLPQLTPSTQTWLQEKCRSWKEKLDGHIAEISAIPTDFERVRTAADETVRKLIQALRTGPPAQPA